MIDLLLKVIGFVVRVGLILAGLVFFASLLAAAVLVLLVWLLRAAWAKLTGQPVNPWTFKVNRQAVWQRFYRGAAPVQSEVVDLDATDVSVVTDVEPKRIEPMPR